MTKFFKKKVSRFVTKSYRERDNGEDEQDLARFWTNRISLEAGTKYVQWCHCIFCNSSLHHLYSNPYYNLELMDYIIIEIFLNYESKILAFCMKIGVGPLHFVCLKSEKMTFDQTFPDPTFFWRRIFQIGQKINDRLAMEIRSILESFPVRATEGEVLRYFGPTPIFIQDLDS